MNHQLEKVSCTLVDEKKELEEKFSEGSSKLIHLEQKCNEFENLVEEMRQEKEEHEQQSVFIEEMNHELEFLREYCETLKTRLSNIESGKKVEEGDESGVKSLLGEIDDRRKDLEEQYQTLNSRHSVLYERHSRIQQEKVKNTNLMYPF